MKTIDRRLFKPVLTFQGIEILLPKMIDLVGMETAQVAMLQNKDINPNDRNKLVNRKDDAVRFN